MDNLGILWIVLLPLAGAIINGLAGRYNSKGLISTIAVGAVLGSFFLALNAFFDLSDLRAAGSEENLVFDLWTWFEISIPTIHGSTPVPIEIRFVVDELSSVMLLVITGIGSLIHIYSMGYMDEEDEAGYARFFSYLNLFMASMLILVLASSFVVMFVGWEGVGLCSYLLIGFWYQNPSYAAAGRKAFVANRVGDFGVIIGMLGLVAVAGSFEFSEINAQATRIGFEQFDLAGVALGSVATVAGLFIFLGCTGKSAQVPLFVWLPDAMAGPTPVSALIHAATMVTAGVYLCCRLSPVLMQSTTVLTVIAVTGTVTAFIAATIAVVQKEMKKILAYSTVSQLGFMFAAVGVGAFAAGFFHVFTHAFFKACLFLGAGSVMHSVHAHGDANILKLGGLKDKMPMTRWTFLISTAAIAGFPLTAGFFSKDELLLGAATVAFNEVALPAWVGWFVMIGLFLAATMTAFYMYRLYYLTFTGTYRSAEGAAHHDDEHDHAEGEDEHAEEHAHADHDEGHDGDGHDHDHGYHPRPHESELPMTFPLMVLAFGAATVGFLGLPHHWFPNWWGHWMSGSMAHLPGFGPEDHSENMTPVYLAMGLGVAAWLIGMGLATVKYREKNEDRFTTGIPGPLYRFLFDKWRFDELYDATVLRLSRGLAVFAGRIDQSFVDGMLTKLPAWAAMKLGHMATRLQVGVVHAYGLVVVVGLFGVGWWFLYPHAQVEVSDVDNDSATMSVGRGLGYEYRFDLDGDGNFDVPEQPSIVFIDLADDITRAEANQVVALVRSAIAPVRWPADRSALGALVDREHKIYELHPPVEEIGDLRLALERAERVDEVRWENAGERFGSETRAEANFAEKDHQGYALVLRDRRGGEAEFFLSEDPLLLGAGDLGPAWAREDAEDLVELAIWVNAEGEIKVRPNAANVRVRGQGQTEEFTMAPGSSAFFGGAVARVYPYVETVVEVRNAFGNVDRETIEIVLKPTEAAPTEVAANAQEVVR